jgi:signal peptidase I
LLGRVTGFFAGKTFINAVSDHDGELREENPITEHNFLLFFPYCTLHFKDGHTINISAPFRQLTEPGNLGLQERTGLILVNNGGITPDGKTAYIAQGGGPPVTKGQVLARGILNSGDQVIVNKFLYHFRRPIRGEVFVFTTKNITGIQDAPNVTPFDRAGGSQHYIKRLAGVPGDSIDVQAGELIINGRTAEEPGFRRVMEGARTPHSPADLARGVYRGYSPTDRSRGMHYLPITLATAPRREYFAMGDNSFNSSDSRYWGPVPEKNIVGPGWICYLPFTSRWGVIH